MDFSSWENDILRQPTVAHHPKGLVVLAAIGESPFTSITLTAVEIRLYTATVADA